MLSLSVNEPLPRPDSEHCPICRMKIPFSLALHMAAVHSPEAKRRGAQTAEGALPYGQVVAYQDSRSKSPSGSKRRNHSHRAKSGFTRRKGKGGR